MDPASQGHQELILTQTPQLLLKAVPVLGHGNRPGAGMPSSLHGCVNPNVPWCLCCLSCSLPFVLEGSGCPHPAPELLQVWTSHLTVDLRAELQKINEAKANEALHACPSGCQHRGWHLCSMMASGCVFPFSSWHRLLLRAAAMLN